MNFFFRILFTVSILIPLKSEGQLSTFSDLHRDSISISEIIEISDKLFVRVSGTNGWEYYQIDTSGNSTLLLDGQGEDSPLLNITFTNLDNRFLQVSGLRDTLSGRFSDDSLYFSSATYKWPELTLESLHIDTTQYFFELGTDGTLWGQYETKSKAYVNNYVFTQFGGDYQLDVYRFNKHNLSTSKFTIPKELIGNFRDASAASDTALYFSNAGATRIFQYDADDGSPERIAELTTWDTITGTNLTGFYSEPAIAVFDSSLYVYTTCFILDPTTPDIGDGTTAMNLMRFKPDLSGWERVVVDSQIYDNRVLRPAFFNKGASVSPGGERLFLCAFGATEARDTMRWYVHVIGDDFERIADYEIKLPFTSQTRPSLGGIYALKNGGAILYGQDNGILLMYRIDPDSGFISDAIEIPLRQAVSDQPFAYPNPAPVSGRVTIDQDAVIKGAELLFIQNEAGQLVGQYSIEQLTNRTLTLPSTAGIYILSVLSEQGELIQQQRVFKP